MADKDKKSNRKFTLTHDEFIRKSFENPAIAREFFEVHLPEDIRKAIDLSSLKSEKETFVEEDLKKSLSDVLFSCKFTDDNESYVDGFIYYLVESQSKPDYWMPFRILKYVVNILEHYKTQNPQAKKLPPVYTLVLYNGKQRYNAPLRLWELFTKPDIARKFFDNGYTLVDLNLLNEQELQVQGKQWLAIMELALKNAIIRDMTTFADILRMCNLLSSMSDPQKINDYMKSIICYYNISKEEYITVKSQLEKEDISMLNVMQESFNEGKQEGIQQGMEIEKSQIAQELLDEGMEVQKVAKVTKLSVEQVKTIILSLNKN